MKKGNFNIIYIILGLFLFAFIFGLICRNTVLAKESSESTTEDHLSDEELDHILRVSQQWLDKNGYSDEELASSTDAGIDFDTSNYFTYDYDQEWIDKDTSVNSALNDIYRMILSIRNILLVFFLAVVVFWLDKKLHAIINKLFRG